MPPRTRRQCDGAPVYPYFSWCCSSHLCSPTSNFHSAFETSRLPATRRQPHFPKTTCGSTSLQPVWCAWSLALGVVGRVLRDQLHSIACKYTCVRCGKLFTALKNHVNNAHANIFSQVELFLPDKSWYSFVWLPCRFCESIPLYFDFVFLQFYNGFNDVEVILPGVCTLRTFCSFISEFGLRFCTHRRPLNHGGFFIFMICTKLWAGRRKLGASCEDLDACWRRVNEIYPDLPHTSPWPHVAPLAAACNPPTTHFHVVSCSEICTDTVGSHQQDVCEVSAPKSFRFSWKTNKRQQPRPALKKWRGTQDKRP